jgi:glycerol-3-phosphate dehydrogenase (NAD(P)+)
MEIGLIGSGSWGTALAKLITDHRRPLHWCVRNEDIIKHINARHHNPNYLTSVHFDTSLLMLTDKPVDIFKNCEWIVIAIPSAYVMDQFRDIPAELIVQRKIVSAVKGILPQNNLLLNTYLEMEYGFPMDQYFTIMGPCHAEEVAHEKLSYLTFSGLEDKKATQLSHFFKGENLNTVINNDIFGVQYAAILKNIYALGAGIAHGLEYGDNFQAVLIANAADEMAGFLKKLGIHNMEVGVHQPKQNQQQRKSPNYAASVYLGDLLVTCYSPFSRNRTFGNMVGKGYSVLAAQMEMNMVAEGYKASKSMYENNKTIGADIPIAETIYKILWEQVPAKNGFEFIESILV